MTNTLTTKMVTWPSSIENKRHLSRPQTAGDQFSWDQLFHFRAKTVTKLQSHLLQALVKQQLNNQQLDARRQQQRLLRLEQRRLSALKLNKRKNQHTDLYPSQQPALLDKLLQKLWLSTRRSRLDEIAAENESDLSLLTYQCLASLTVSEDWITDVTTPPDQAASEELSVDLSLLLFRILTQLSAEANDTTIQFATQRTSFSSTPGTSYFLTKATRVRFTGNLYILSPEETFLLTEDGQTNRSGPALLRMAEEIHPNTATAGDRQTQTTSDFPVISALAC